MMLAPAGSLLATKKGATLLTVSLSLAVDVALLTLAVVTTAVGALDDAGGAARLVRVVVAARLGGLGPVEEDEEEDHGEGGEGEGADGLGHGGSGEREYDRKRGDDDVLCGCEESGGVLNNAWSHYRQSFCLLRDFPALTLLVSLGGISSAALC